MTPHVRKLIIAALLIPCVIGLLFLQRPEASVETSTAVVLEANNTQAWHKGNLHTHSHWSDGDDYLESIAMWYREHDYQFLCFTDHNILANSQRWVTIDKTKGGRKAFDKLKARFPDWVEERERNGQQQVRLRTFPEVSEKVAQPGKFLLIQGEEISDAFSGKPIHMNASNLQELIPPMKGKSVSDTIQNNVNALIAQRERTRKPMMIHLNHPNFGWAVTAEDLMRIRGEKFFEVYNGHPGVNDSGNAQRASTERIWDILLTFRLARLNLPVMYGLATDDGHSYHNIPSRASEPGRGWVMVLADRLDPGSMIDAMEAGRFYSSSGVTLKRIVSSEKGLEVEIDPVPGETYTIEFIGTKKDFDDSSQPVTDANGKEIETTRQYSKDIGQVFKSTKGTKATYPFKGDEIYVRALITSSATHPNPSEVGEAKRAWVQPVLGPGIQNEAQ